MASSKIKGITIEIGGDTTKLGRAIADVEKQSNSLKGELKQVEKLLKMDPGNTELLAQKQEILTRAVSETTEKLKILKEAEEQVVKQFENGDIGEDQLRAFQREIIKTESELKGFRDELDGAVDDIEEVGDVAEESSDGFTIMGGALADLVSSAIQGAISAIGDFIGSLMELSEATEEYRTMQAKLEGSANTFGYSMEFASSKYEEFYKYLGDDQMSTNAITNLMGLGTSTESLTALAEGAIGVWSAYGDSIPIEGLTEALNETAQVGKVTGSLADALNWAGISEDEFNEKLEKCNSTQDRADLLAKTLNDTYGESKKTYDELNSSVTDANEAELALKDTQAELGETMAPVNTAITDLKNKALEAITPLVKDLADAFLNLLTWMKEHPGIMKALTAVVIALGTAFTILAGALAIQGLITGVSKAMAFLNTTFLANPIFLIITAITALVSAFIYLWNNCEGFRNFWINLWNGIKTAFSAFMTWLSPAIEAIKGFFVSLWAKIQEIWSAIMTSLQPLFDSIVGAFREGWELIKVIWDYVKPYFLGIWNGIKSIFSAVKTVLSMYFKNAWLSIKLIWSVAVLYFKTIWSNIKAVFSVVKVFFEGAFKTAWIAIKAIWNGVVGYFASIWSTIKGIFSVVKNVLTGNWRDAWNGIKGIVGTWVSYFRGIWNSIKTIFSSVKSWFSSTFSSAWSAVRNVFSNWGSFFSGLWSRIRNTFSNIGTNISNAIGSAVRSGINGVISMIEGTINSGINMINGAVRLINKIPGVNIGGFGHVYLPRLATGGIVDRPTIAQIGENGAEAIVPLEKNTGWLREVARELNSQMEPTAGINNAEVVRKLDGIYERLGRIKMVTETGALVGEIIDQIDAGLGAKQILTARGV